MNQNELLELSLNITEQTPVSGCRSLDIMHVAAAKCINVAQFVTFDQKQRELALKFGVMVADI